MGIAGFIKWNGPQVVASTEIEVRKRLTACAILVSNQAKRLISTPYPPPSVPEEPPHRRTGRLRSSVTYEVKDRTAFVGTNVKYGRWLELGTSKIAARPWLRRALIEMTPQIMKIMGR